MRRQSISLRARLLQAAKAAQRARRNIAGLIGGWSNSELFEKFSLSIKDSAILTLDRSGMITGWSAGAARMTGYGSDEMIGCAFSLLYLPQELIRDRPAEALRVASELGRFAEEGIRVRRDGTTLWVAMTILKSHSRWRSGNRFTCVLTDITETVRIRSELLRVREAASSAGLARQGRLLSSALAHDLSNILNEMSLRLELMRAAAGAPAQTDNLDRVRRLVGDVSSVIIGVQTGSGALASIPVPIDPANLIRTAVDRVREQLQVRYPDSNRVLHVDLEIGALKTVVLVPEDLSEVLERLILSICDAMPAGGALMINASTDLEHLTIAIEQHRLVTPGARDMTRSIESSISEAGGISRSLAQSGLIARLGASLHVEDREGASAVISLSLPTGNLEYPAPPRPAGGDPIEPAREDGIAPLKVLIIDDNADNLDALRELLEHKGYAVVATANGYDALRHMRNGMRFDFVICDIGMPGMNGWEVAEETAVLAPGTQVMLVTGWASEIGRDDPRRKLVVDVLPKPIDFEVINAYIARAAR